MTHTPIADHSWPIRAIMLDAARFTEPYAYYQQLIPTLAEWGYNTILLHLTDDQGCAVRMEHPHVLPTAGAFTPDQWRALANLATDHGFTVIPEIECLGHTGCLTRLPEFAELREPPYGGGQFWSISPTHPDTLQVIRALLTNIAAIFDAPYVHIGMDEADIGGSPRSREALQHKPLWRLFGDYVLEVDAIVRGLGRRTMIWGDHLLSEPALADMLPRDLIICNWLYGRGHREDYAASTRFFLERGYEVIGCPAGCWWGTLFAPHADNLANIANFDRACRSLDHPNILGMSVTMWCPYRHLPATSLPIMHYAGRAFAGGQRDIQRAMTRFVAERFGLQSIPLELATDALTNLHAGRQRSMLEHALLSGDPQQWAARGDELVAYHAVAEAAESALRIAADSVLDHAAEFEQWQITAHTMRELAAWGLDHLAGKPPAPLAERAAALAANYERVWMSHRAYAGTEADEPALGQTPRAQPDTDILLELLRGLTSPGEPNAAGATS
ncbi:MAG: family 20 glycosylhydrolase [Chloroflexi bacterium]|jgi:hypothetical protein|nr:family 20 glycosylhydrolase [Chloroflexota bacterium]